MTLHASAYHVEVRGPLMLEVGVASLASVRVEGPNGYVSPSAGTASLHNGADLVRAGATGTADPVTFAVLDTDTTGADPSSAWWLLWDLTVEGVSVRQVQRVLLGTYRLTCPVTSDMLLDREPTFRDAWPDHQTSWYPQVHDAFLWALDRLMQEERKPHQIRNSDGLVEPILCRALHLAAGLQATYVPDGSRLASKAADYEQATESAWSRMRLDTDTDEDGVVDLERAPAPNPSADTAALRQQWFGG